MEDKSNNTGKFLKNKISCLSSRFFGFFNRSLLTLGML